MFKRFIAVITNLDNNVPNSPGVGSEMYNYLHKVVTVVGVTGCKRYYIIEEDGGEYVWHPSWLDKEFKGIPKPPILPSQKKPTRSKTRLKELLTQIRREAKEHARVSTHCHYALVSDTKRGYEVSRHFNDVCHARIANYNLGGNVVALINFAGAPRERFKGEEYDIWLKYSDYIINRSYAKDAFIPTRMSDFVQHGVLANLEATSTNVMTGMNALRMGSEHRNRMLPMFDLLTKKGFDEGVAFLMGTSFVQNEDGYVVSIVSFHNVISRSASLKKLVQVAAGTFKFPKGRPYRIQPSGWAVFKSISSNKGTTWENYLDTTVKGLVGSRRHGWGTIVPKPMTEAQFLIFVTEFQDLVDKEKGV